MKLTNTQTKIGAAVAVALLIVGMTYAVVPSPATCQSDPSATIAALPSGGTFNGTGCYNVPNGIRITQSVTINGGIYNDPTTTVGKVFRPIIEVRGASNVTLANLTVNGANTANKLYQASLVNEAGIDLKNTTNVVIRNVITNSTFGDGLELWTTGPTFKNPNTNVTVDGLTVNRAGRNALTPADVTASSFTNMHLNSWGLTAVDFESDITGVGAGNLTFSNSTWGGTFLQETFTGPVTFSNIVMSNTIFLFARHPVIFPITFNGGSLAIGKKSNQVGVTARGPTGATFNGVTFTRTGTKNKSPMWTATGGSTLRFNQSTLVFPLGINDTASTVTVTP